MPTYKFPLGALGAPTGAELDPLLGFLPSTGRANNRWLIGLSSVCGIAVFASIAVGASLGNPPAGGHGDAEGVLWALLVTFLVIAGLAGLLGGVFLLNGRRTLRDASYRPRGVLVDAAATGGAVEEWSERNPMSTLCLWISGLLLSLGLAITFWIVFGNNLPASGDVGLRWAALALALVFSCSLCCVMCCMDGKYQLSGMR